MMIDEKTKDIMDLYDIKQDIVKTMLIYKYLNLQLKDNKSKNNLDNRINSIYKMIQKLYNNYIELNDIITNSD